MNKLLVIIIILFIAGCANTNEPVSDKLNLCVGVVDGDTYDFKDKSDTIRVRELYIDCFETRYGTRLDNQAKKAGITPDSALHLGLMVKEFVRDLIENKRCELVIDPKEEDTDIYGRYLRLVKINNQRLDSILLEKGLAIPF